MGFMVPADLRSANSLSQQQSPSVLGQRFGRSLDINNFAKSFGGSVSPSFVKLSPNINIKLGRSADSDFNDKDNDSSPPSKSKVRRGGRPHKNSAYGQINNVSSTKLTYSTGIPSGLVVNPYEKSSEEYSTLFVMSGSFFSRSSTNSIAHDLLNRQLFNEYLFDVQNVNYRADRDFSKEKFYQYFSTIIAALQLYYFVDSVLAYFDSPNVKFKNPGMNALREYLTADVLSEHFLLKSTLVQYPIPGNILSTVRYFYQNFSLVDDPTSPIIRLGFRDVLHRATEFKFDSNYYKVIRDELDLTDKRVPSLLRITHSDMLVDDLPLSSSLPIYDVNFSTFWCNQTVSHLSSDEKKVVFTRHVESVETYFNYFTFNGSDVDGLFSSLMSTFHNETKILEPGIWSPISDLVSFKQLDKARRCSLLCFSSTGDTFITPKCTSTLSQSGVYHGCYYDSETSRHIDTLLVPQGANKIQSCSLRLLDQSVSMTVRWLFEKGQSTYRSTSSREN